MNIVSCIKLFFKYKEKTSIDFSIGRGFFEKWKREIRIGYVEYNKVSCERYKIGNHRKIHIH